MGARTHTLPFSLLFLSPSLSLSLSLSHSLSLYLYISLCLSLVCCVLCVSSLNNVSRRVDFVSIGDDFDSVSICVSLTLSLLQISFTGQSTGQSTGPSAAPSLLRLLRLLLLSLLYHTTNASRNNWSKRSIVMLIKLFNTYNSRCFSSSAVVAGRSIHANLC